MKVNIPIWQGQVRFQTYRNPSTGSSNTQPTPFGYFDGDSTFVSDADRVPSVFKPIGLSYSRCRITGYQLLCLF